MKVLFITQDDPIYVKEFVDELLKAERDTKFAGVVLASPTGRQTIKDLVLQMRNLYGAFNFVLMGIRCVMPLLPANTMLSVTHVTPTFVDVGPEGG